ncbi:MAG TPA: hypothetical protein VFE84_09040, partial [Patescibacteria group bacterium]|nr:hypothetical protein [Patescibacteria group bacterium]
MAHRSIVYGNPGSGTEARCEVSGHGAPSVVLLEHSQIVEDDFVSAALPAVVMYDDGYVIFRSKEGGGIWHLSAGVIRDQRESIL